MGGLEAPILEGKHVIIGEDWTFNINVRQQGVVTPQTMTGWTLEWKLLNRQGGTALMTKTTSSGITIQNGTDEEGVSTGGTDDAASVSIDAADWNGITRPGTLFHTLARTDSGSVQVLAFGPVVVHAALATA